MDFSSMILSVLELGAYKAAVVGVEQIRFDRSFRDLCKSNACGNYNRCWTCPPDAGDIDELMARAKGFEYALVYQTVSALEDSYDFEGMMEAGKKHNQLTLSVTQWVNTLALPRVLHLGAGGCRICENCAKKTNDPCRHPDQALVSLETYGIAVSEMAEACDMKYINGQNTVTYFSALLFCQTPNTK